MTPLSKEERAGLVAEIAEVEARIRELEAPVGVIDYGHASRIRSVTFRIIRDSELTALRARLAGLKRREASEDER